MEYIRPLTPLSFRQRLHVLWLDLIFVLSCVRRFFDDHLLDPIRPTYDTLLWGKDRVQRKLRDRGKQKKTNEKKCDEEVKKGTGENGTRDQSDSSSSELDTPSSNPSTPSSPSSSSSSSSSSSPSAARPPHQLRVLSLNLWGLPISPRTSLRCRELCKSLHLFDLVAFQELSHEREFRLLRDHCARLGLRHCQQFSNGVGFPIWHGVTAPSLVVFSRYPIIDVIFKRFSINGKMYKAAHADYMGAKGVGLVRIDVSQLIYPHLDGSDTCRPVVGIDVFLTHLHANYTHYQYDYRQWLPLLQQREDAEMEDEEEDDGAEAAESEVSEAEYSHHTTSSRLPVSSTTDARRRLPIPSFPDVMDEYLAHRVLQSYELSRFIAANRRPDFMTLLCGDLNAPPYDLCVQLIQSLTFGQSDGCVPRLIDSFRELHPYSNGFTCGAKDNTFTFSAEPLHMKPRVLPRVRGERMDRMMAAHSTAAVHAANGSNGMTAYRSRFNSSPSDPALIPSDGNLRPSRTHGEHATLLPSSPRPNSIPEMGDDCQCDASWPETAESMDGTGDVSGVTVNGYVTPCTSPIAGGGSIGHGRRRSTMAWSDCDQAKRIDYIFYSNPVEPMRCRCAWAHTQLPFQHPITAIPAAGCECRNNAGHLPAPEKSWRVVSSSIFKQYMMEPDGRMTSISDHHGVSVVLEFQLNKPEIDANAPPSLDTSVAEDPTSQSQPTSTIIISQLSGVASDTANPTLSSASANTAPSRSPPLRRRRITFHGNGTSSFSSGSERSNPAEAFEKELLTLDPPIIQDEEVRMRSYSSSSSLNTLVNSSAPVFSVPPLSTSSLLLLTSGVLWMGLKDATDRRSHHVTRMAHAFAIFIIGSRHIWLYILNTYFETLMQAYVLPDWLVSLHFPPLLVVVVRFLLFLLDWAHALLPIYIVLEWLLTTFPAKEEQTTMRQAIAEVNTLRRFINNQQREKIRKQRRKMGRRRGEERTEELEQQPAPTIDMQLTRRGGSRAESDQNSDEN